MQSVLAPEFIRVVHEQRIHEALRHALPEHAYNGTSTRAGGVKLTLRRRLGRWLVAAGTRVAQERRPTSESLPTGGIAVAGTVDR